MVFFLTLCCPNGNFPHIRVAFPQGNPAATESSYPTLINYKVHAGSFCVIIVHWTLTWTTGSLACVRDHSYAYVYTLGLHGHTDSKSAQHFWLWKNSLSFSCAPDGVRTSSLWTSSPTLYQLSHPVTQYDMLWSRKKNPTKKQTNKLFHFYSQILMRVILRKAWMYLN